MIVCIYFLIFSNLFPTIILVSFFCFVILSHVFRNIKTHTVFSNLKQIQIPVLGLILWIVSLVFEWKGARATSEDLTYDFDLMGTVKSFISTLIHSLNIWFVVFAAVVVVVSAAKCGGGMIDQACQAEGKRLAIAAVMSDDGCHVSGLSLGV